VCFVTVEGWPTAYAPMEPRTRKVVLLTSGQSGAASFAFIPTLRTYLPTMLLGQ
jgi:hypothetical protein